MRLKGTEFVTNWQPVFDINQATKRQLRNISILLSFRNSYSYLLSMT
jgi:hypothetical protein